MTGARNVDGGVPRRDQPRGLGWVDVTRIDGEVGLAVGIPDFWQSAPRSLGVSGDGSIRVGLFAGTAAGQLGASDHVAKQDLYFGVARTTELILLPHGEITTAELAKFFNAAFSPLLPMADPAQYCQATGVYGKLISSGADFGEHEQLVADYDAKLDASLTKILARQNEVTYNGVSADSYGWLNWGDTLHWAFGPGKDKPVVEDPDPKILQWDAAHYDYPWAMILQGLRTGEQKFVRRGLLGAHYAMDVHHVHLLAEDPRTGAARYCPARFHVATDSPEPAIDPRMDWLAGLGVIARWHLTGDYRARQVAIEIAGRALRGRAELAGWDSPRGPGNQIHILIAASAMIEDERYLEQAQRVAAMAARVAARNDGDFPDKSSNRYRMGVGLEGLVRLAEVRPDPELTATIRRVVDIALARNMKGYSVNMAMAVGYLAAETGQKKSRDALVNLLNACEVTSRTKYFGCWYRTTPYALHYLHAIEKD
jgi:hypothetical protein